MISNIPLCMCNFKMTLFVPILLKLRGGDKSPISPPPPLDQPLIHMAFIFLSREHKVHCMVLESVPRDTCMRVAAHDTTRVCSSGVHSVKR